MSLRDEAESGEWRVLIATKDATAAGAKALRLGMSADRMKNLNKFHPHVTSELSVYLSLSLLWLCHLVGDHLVCSFMRIAQSTAQSRARLSGLEPSRSKTACIVS